MSLDSERLLQERTRALETANEGLRQNQQRLQAELYAAERLQNIATQLITARGTAELYDCRERGDGELRLLSHRGFSEEAAERWEWVRFTTPTACGEALRTGRRVVVPDVRDCDFIAGSDELGAFMRAGIRAVQSTPLVSRTGALVGMVSTHWREPRDLTTSELRALDVLARLAADLIERSLAEKTLHESEARLALAQNAAQLGVWDSDLRTNVIAIYGKYAELHGFSPDRTTITRGEWERLIHPEDRKRVDSLRREARERTHTFDAEFRVRRPGVLTGYTQKVRC